LRRIRHVLNLQFRICDLFDICNFEFNPIPIST